ncbi:MAG: peptide chain release factor 3 [Acidimicrobiaceae bacterium]|nr:peptide chain release factor 3 [Acidimicrobiaceae bacterium]MYF44121.1 peptide chain release factor 3 [Acidimicrobiaceae bacterium]
MSTDAAPVAADVRREAARRRTFAIISHPDAGKTTLTEKFLLYGGALTAGAGSVRGKGGRQATASDWMEMERRRGISVTSAVVQFSYGDRVLNLLDTPGHGDFSEDTYRVLSAVDAAVMVLDGAKGIEAQTRKLFEVCRNREIPIVTFINKWDRPARDPLELLDEIEDQLVLDPVPVTWPVGEGERFSGVIDRRGGDFVRFARTAGGATVAGEEIVEPGRAEAEEGAAWHEAREALELIDAASAELDIKRFEAGELSPVFYGSALTNFGVRLLLDAIVDMAPAPGARLDAGGDPRAVDAPFSAVVFKVQSNMDPAHRDRIAFLRVCSGRFERGMTVAGGDTGKAVATKYAHTVVGRDRSTAEEAWPGDVIGLVNAADLRVGDAVHAAGEPVRWPPVPSFAPSSFRVARCSDTSKAKQFRSGVRQLDSEGVVQVLRRPEGGESAPILAAVGPLQFDVAEHRLRHEFGAPVELAPAPWTTARRTDRASAAVLGTMSGVAVAERAEGGELLALFESPYWLARLQADHPELVLERLIGEG